MARPSDPVARLVVPTTAKVGDVVMIDASASYDPGGFIKSAQLQLGDGVGVTFPSRDLTVHPHIYREAGDKRIILTVVDNQKHSAKAEAVIRIEPLDAPPVPVDAVWMFDENWQDNDDFKACQPDPNDPGKGISWGTETRYPVLVEPAKNGGSNIAPPPETRPVSRQCTYVPPVTECSAWQPAAEGGTWGVCELDPTTGAGHQKRTEYRICGETSEQRIVWQPCDYVPPPPPPPPADLPLPPAETDRLTHSAYFELASRLDIHTVYHQRSDAEIARVPPRAVVDTKLETVYDPVKDAATYHINPTGTPPNGGSTGTMQRRVPIKVRGERTTLTYTWQMELDESLRYRDGVTEKLLLFNADGTPKMKSDGVTQDYETITDLDQHKSHRVDDWGEAPWLGIKQFYKGGRTAPNIAEYFFSAQNQFMGPGSARGGSEKIGVIQPDGTIKTPPNYYIQANKPVWTVIHIDGNLGIDDCAVKLSVWVIDDRGVVTMLDRVNMLSPIDGFGVFRFEFDSSKKKALNGLAKQWNRNFMCHKGTSYDDVVREFLPRLATR